MASLKSMSVKELVAYRKQQQDAIQKAKQEFRKAGKVLAAKEGAEDLKAMKAKKAHLEKEIAMREGSDG
jgi:hypothetical protein